MTIDLENMPVGCKSHFLDSGSFSLWTQAAEYAAKHPKKGKYGFYDTDAFWEYVDQYAAFIKKYKAGIDLYANVDVIPDRSLPMGDEIAPVLTLRNQKYLQDEHGLDPIPVVHYKENLIWLERYYRGGYKLIALGGLVGAPEAGARGWLDRAFSQVCNAEGIPQVRLHGFGITSYHFLIRYPWWSVDSAAWTKIGAYGGILMPRRRGRKFTFWESDYQTGEMSPLEPYLVKVSREASKKDKERVTYDSLKLDTTVPVSTKAKNGVLHYDTMNEWERKEVRDWLEEIKIPFGKVRNGEMIDPGVCSRHSERKAANLLFFERLRQALPDWPWPFRHMASKTRTLS